MKRRYVITVIVLVAVAAAAVVVMRPRREPVATRPDVPLPPVAQQFMAILPKDLSKDQTDEIAGIFRRFYDRAQRGEVRAEDEVDVGRRLEAHLAEGSISREALNTLMARVSYYSMRTQLGDEESTMHPLLEEPDTTR